MEKKKAKHPERLQSFERGEEGFLFFFLSLLFFPRSCVMAELLVSGYITSGQGKSAASHAQSRLNQGCLVLGLVF